MPTTTIHLDADHNVAAEADAIHTVIRETDSDGQLIGEEWRTRVDDLDAVASTMVAASRRHDTSLAIMRVVALGAFVLGIIVGRSSSSRAPGHGGA